MKKFLIPFSLMMFAITQPVMAKTSEISFKTYKFDYQVPQKVQKLCQQKILDLAERDVENRCMIVDIELLNTNYPWINQAINQDFSDPRSVEKIRLAYDHQAEDIYNMLQDPEMVQPYQFETTQNIKLVGTSPRLTQIAVINYEYYGGAHGMPSRSFYVLDMTTKKALKLDDILVSFAKKDQFERIAFEQFKIFFKEFYAKYDLVFSEKEFNEHLKTWEFELTDNFYFTPTGLTLSYNPYHLGPYVMGFTILNIDKEKLQGIVKDEYLNQQFEKFQDDEWSKEKNESFN